VAAIVGVKADRNRVRRMRDVAVLEETGRGMKASGEMEIGNGDDVCPA
jgi:hypothetical protein